MCTQTLDVTVINGIIIILYYIPVTTKIINILRNVPKLKKKEKKNDLRYRGITISLACWFLLGHLPNLVSS